MREENDTIAAEASFREGVGDDAWGARITGSAHALSTLCTEAESHRLTSAVDTGVRVLLETLMVTEAGVARKWKRIVDASIG